MEKYVKKSGKPTECNGARELRHFLMAIENKCKIIFDGFSQILMNII